MERLYRRSMFKNILVPLDGSAVSEAALPSAKALAARAGGRLILVRAAHVQRAMAGAVNQQRAIAEAEEYLSTRAKELATNGFEIETGVPFGGSAARWILEEVDLRHADMVIMATHDRIGPDRWVHGSVAEAVVGHADVPVLLIRPTHAAQLADGLIGQRPVLVVPLDGSVLAEGVLPRAREFAATFAGHIVLVGVVPRPGDLMAAPGGVMSYVGDDHKRLQAEAEDYLNGIASQLTADGLSVDVAVRSGNPAQQIAATASEHSAVAVVMASHGRTGIVRSILGSVAGETLHRSPCPVMLIRPATLRPAEEPAPSQPTRMQLIIA
jgi:nucleotide-binding universal stress UspA family protein